MNAKLTESHSLVWSVIIFLSAVLSTSTELLMVSKQKRNQCLYKLVILKFSAEYGGVFFISVCKFMCQRKLSFSIIKNLKSLTLLLVKNWKSGMLHIVNTCKTPTFIDLVYWTQVCNATRGWPPGINGATRWPSIHWAHGSRWCSTRHLQVCIGQTPA